MFIQQRAERAEYSKSKKLGHEIRTVGDHVKAGGGGGKDGVEEGSKDNVEGEGQEGRFRVSWESK